VTTDGHTLIFNVSRSAQNWSRRLRFVFTGNGLFTAETLPARLKVNKDAMTSGYRFDRSDIDVDQYWYCVTAVRLAGRTFGARGLARKTM